MFPTTAGGWCKQPFYPVELNLHERISMYLNVLDNYPITNETFQHHNKPLGGECVKAGSWLVTEEDRWIRQHLLS